MFVGEPLEQSRQESGEPKCCHAEDDRGVICGSVAAGVGRLHNSTGRIRLADLRNDVLIVSKLSTFMQISNASVNARPIQPAFRLRS